MQEKLCIEPKEPDQALDFAIAYEEGVKRQKTYGMEKVHTGNASDAGIKTSQWNVNFCMATNHRCKHCKIEGHLEKCCNKKFPQRQKEMMQRLKGRENQQGMRRVNYIGESEEDEEALQIRRRSTSSTSGRRR